MKVLLPLRNGLENMELLYALRSWERNLLMDLELIVVGDEIPNWLKPDRMIAGNQYENAQMNVYNNIRYGCEALSGEEKVLIMNDDFFVMDPVCHIIPTYRGTMQDHMRNVKGSAWWAESLRTTVAYLKEKGIEKAISYELHRPCVVRPADMAAVLRDAADYAPSNPPQWRTIYGNLTNDWSMAVKARDAKSIRTTQIPIGIPFVSTDDVKWRQYWGRLIAPRFPDPSRWESGPPNQKRKP